MTNTHFTSALAAEYHEDLENLLFFNLGQRKLTQAIEKSVEHYGSPRIIQQGNRLHIAVGNSHEVQTLFAIEERLLRPRLVGCVIYVRDPIDSLTILHMVVVDDMVMPPISTEIPLAVRMFSEVMEVAKHIKGIASVVVLYGKGKPLPIRV